MIESLIRASSSGDDATIMPFLPVVPCKPSQARTTRWLGTFSSSSGIYPSGRRRPQLRLLPTKLIKKERGRERDRDEAFQRIITDGGRRRTNNKQALRFTVVVSCIPPPPFFRWSNPTAPAHTSAQRPHILKWPGLNLHVQIREHACYTPTRESSLTSNREYRRCDVRSGD